MKLSISLVFAVLLSFATANAEHLCDFAPKNDLQIPVRSGNEINAGGIDQATFDRILDKLEKIYSPIVTAKGGTLKMNHMWTKAEVNSSADRKGKIWNINAYGGLARHALMTEDGEAMVICHELGHHLGGFPQAKGIFGTASWASNEGQSDYFATMKCFRRYAENDDNIALMSSVTLPKEVTAGCSLSFKSAKEIALCERSSLAGKVLANLLYSLNHASKDAAGEPANSPDFGTPSTAVVSATNSAHPLAQCRLDTYFNGAICGMPYTDDFGAKDAVTGACAQEKGDKFGFRPTCWYKPKM